MSDTTDTTSATDAPGGTGVNDDGQAHGGRDDDGARGGDDASTSTLSLEDARKLRSEAANLRKRLKAAEDDIRKRDDGDLSERQKLERELTGSKATIAQLEARLRDVTVQSAASKLGVKADLVDTIAPLLDWDEVDASDPKAIERAVRALVKERPSLSANVEGHQGGAGRGTGSGNEGGDMNSLIRRMAGRQ